MKDPNTIHFLASVWAGVVACIENALIVAILIVEAGLCCFVFLTGSAGFFIGISLSLVNLLGLAALLFSWISMDPLTEHRREKARLLASTAFSAGFWLPVAYALSMIMVQGLSQMYYFILDRREWLLRLIFAALLFAILTAWIAMNRWLLSKVSQDASPARRHARLSVTGPFGAIATIGLAIYGWLALWSYVLGH